MNQLEKNALEFVEHLKKHYFEERNLEKLLLCFHEDISWLGSGANEISHGFAHTKENLVKDFQEYGGTFSIHDMALTAKTLTEDICLVYGSLLATPDVAVLDTLSLHVSAICQETEGEMKLLHGDFSTTDFMQEEGQFFVPSGRRVENRLLQDELAQKNVLLDNIIKNIPGGTLRCANDVFFTMLEVSDGFIDMFGYNREEIETIFSHQFIEMIYVPDRQDILRQTREQLQEGNTVELEYRVMCKSGEPLWILDKGRLIEDGKGGSSFYRIMVEINERKQAQEQLRLAVEQYQVIMDQATDIIFQWDITTDMLTFSPNWKKKFGYEAIASKISHEIPISPNIHKDDMPAFVKIMRDTAAGVPYSETEFRIRDIKGDYIWCAIRATTQFDSAQRPIRAIGVIMDISAQKKEKEALLELAQRDSLTGLLNKTTLQSMVESRMGSRSSHMAQALFIIDVDFFKSVNDTYGHLCGDTLLLDVSAVLKSQFRATDIIGRIGGDEFIVYLPEVPSYEITRAKAESLCMQLKKIRPQKDATPISCSVGVVLTMDNVTDYVYLYRCADMALYQRKNAGRDGVTFYDADALEGTGSKKLTETVMSEAVSGDGEEVDVKLAEYIFHLLYEANDIEKAVRQLLDIVGRTFDVSRVYVFERSLEGNHGSETFSWTLDGNHAVEQREEKGKRIDDFDAYLDNFNENGILYCKDITTLAPELYDFFAATQVRSLLQCTIFDHGISKGFIGFDECREEKYWTKQQVATLTLVAGVLSVFLTKYRLEQQLLRMMKEKRGEGDIL